MEALFDLLNKWVHDVMYSHPHDVKQKWIKLAMLKCNIRYGLLSYENNFMCHVPPEKRLSVWYNYLKMKDILWQSVGALHGNITTASMSNFFLVRALKSSCSNINRYKVFLLMRKTWDVIVYVSNPINEMKRGIFNEIFIYRPSCNQQCHTN